MYRDSRVKRSCRRRRHSHPLFRSARDQYRHCLLRGEPRPATATPIQHLVVIFQENVSFDHYFGTYPNAANTDGQPFTANPRHAAVDGLTRGPARPRTRTASNPRRYDPTNVNDMLTCDQDHNYTDEQRAFDGGKMDKFPQTVGTGKGTSPTGAAVRRR